MYYINMDGAQYAFSLHLNSLSLRFGLFHGAEKEKKNNNKTEKFISHFIFERAGKKRIFDTVIFQSRLWSAGETKKKPN